MTSHSSAQFPTPETDTEIEEFCKSIREAVLNDSPEGFILYYHTASGDAMPKHVARMVFEAYDARWHELGLANKCFRGGLKTTIITNWFMSYQVGLHPELSNLLIQDDGPKAHTNAEFIADIIEHNKYFRWFFPNVVPDKKKGWGDKGYEVMRTDMDYADWRRMNSKRHDPSFIGVGYTYQFILGMHPTNLLIIDDMNNEKNTASARTLKKVIDTWDSKIKPAMIEGETWEIYNYTPWVPGDIGDLIERSKYFRSITTPICEDGDIEKPIWPEKFPTEALQRLVDKHTPAQWARMYLVDPSKATGTLLERDWLHFYPYTNIMDSWPTVIGVDYASVKSIQDTAGADQCAIAVMKKVPGGGLILIDGVKMHMTQVMAEEEVYAQNSFHTPDRIGVEALGSGKEFYQILLRKAGLPLRDQTVSNKGKRLRFEGVMAPLFKRGKIWIAGNAEGTDVRPGIPFLQQFVDEWVMWEGYGKYGDDAMDAVFHCILVAKGYIKADEPDTPKEPVKANPYKGFFRKKRTRNK